MCINYPWVWFRPGRLWKLHTEYPWEYLDVFLMCILYCSRWCGYSSYHSAFTYLCEFDIYGSELQTTWLATNRVTIKSSCITVLGRFGCVFFCVLCFCFFFNTYDQLHQQLHLVPLLRKDLTMRTVILPAVPLGTGRAAGHVMEASSCGALSHPSRIQHQRSVSSDKSQSTEVATWNITNPILSEGRTAYNLQTCCSTTVCFFSVPKQLLSHCSH